MNRFRQSRNSMHYENKRSKALLSGRLYDSRGPPNGVNDVSPTKWRKHIGHLTNIESYNCQKASISSR